MKPLVIARLMLILSLSILIIAIFIAFIYPSVGIFNVIRILILPLIIASIALLYQRDQGYLTDKEAKEAKWLKRLSIGFIVLIILVFAILLMMFIPGLFAT